MGIEDEIRTLFSQGHTPVSMLSAYPYKKSTVYKIYREVSTHLVPTSQPPWYVNMTPHANAKRYLPGQTERFSCKLTNNSGNDLYVSRSGLHPEWAANEWYTSDERFLLRPGQTNSLRIQLPIPSDLALGEYELRYGIEGNYLGRGMPSQTGLGPIQWADPFVVHVKRPLSGFKLFLSHSVKDMYQVRQIDQHLDISGIETIIAEDIYTPGAILEEKFKSMIRQSNFFLALLTENGARSEWVIKETNFAHEINKPMLLLKDKEVAIESAREWVEFSRYDNQEVTYAKISEALEHLRKYPQGLTSMNSAGPILLVGLGLFLGLMLANSK